MPDPNHAAATPPAFAPPVPAEDATRDFPLDIVADDGSVIDAQLFLPAAQGRYPAVLLLTDIRGVRPVFVAIARRLAAGGHAVLLPNLFHRVGRAPVAPPDMSLQDEQGRALAAELRASVTRQGMQVDFSAHLRALREYAEVDADRVGVVGYCMGGAISLWLAADFPHAVVAAASIHGGRLVVDGPESPHLLADKISARLYFGHAENDATIPEESIRVLERTLATAGCKFASEIYASARHGFAVADSAAYDAAASQRHWSALSALLGEALRPPPQP